MIEISEDEFKEIVAEAIDSLPAQIEHMKNVAIVIADDPTPEQRTKLHLWHGQLLFGLYEGIPLTQRTNYSLVLPDKITIFKRPLELVSRDLTDLKEKVRNTVWHEIAHHYGLDHDRIDELQQKPEG